MLADGQLIMLAKLARVICCSIELTVGLALADEDGRSVELS